MSTADKVLNEARYRRCRGSSPQDIDAFTYFCTQYVKIQHPTRGAIPFTLREAQITTVEHWMYERYSLVLKARQIGYSTLGAVFFLWLAAFWEDQSLIMLSRNEREAIKLLSKADYAYKRLPEWMRERMPKRIDANVKRISFGNGSVIESLPSKEDPARGSTASKIFVDEWAFLDNPEQAWAAIEPVADVGGSIIGISTANGAGNFFHTLWVGATTGTNKFVAIFFPWSANTDRDDNWYEVQRNKLPPWQLAQEYPDNPEEAFIRSGNPVFDVDALRKRVTRPPVMVGSLDHYKHGIKSPQFKEHENGALKLWVPPEKDDAYVIGADVAEGLEHGDYSCAHVLSTKRQMIVACWHGHIDADLFGEEIAKLGYYYNTAFVGVEVNNHGLTTNKALQRIGYPYLYVRHELDGDTTADDRQQKVGWYTSRVSKPLIIDGLVTALRGDLAVPDEHTIAELLTYVRDEKGLTSGSPHDDRVMALAITWQMAPHVRKTEAQEAKDYYWTAQYFLDKLLNPESPDGYVPIGTYNKRRVA